MGVGEPAADETDREIRRRPGSGRASREVLLSVLGGFALTVDGARVELPKRARRLLALLALSPRGLTRDAAAAELSPHLEQESARAGLRKALAGVRATRLPLVAADRAELRLDPRVRVDLREAEALAKRLADPSQDLPDEADIEALGLEPLRGWTDDWADRARAGIRGEFLRTRDTYALRLDERGERDRALNVARRTWDSDPLHESSVSVLVGIHLADGNVGQALSVYHAYERHLRRGVGVQPSETLRELVAPLLRRRLGS